MRFLALAAVLPTLIIPAAPTAQGPQRSDVSTTLPAEPVEVPMRMVNRRPIVDVHINGGGPYSFLIDTGGSGLARADKSLVEKLKLEVVGEARGAAGTGGQVVSMPIVRYSTLEIGGAVFKNVDAPSRDYNEGRDTQIDGVLGIGLFSTCLVTLDFVRSVLRIERGTLPEPDGKEVFPFTNPRGIAELPIRVAGAEIVAHVDSGAMADITLPLSFAEKLPLTSAPVVVGKAVTVSGPMEISEAALKGNVEIGRHQIVDPTLQFTPAMRQANLGIGVLSEFALTIDQQNRRMRFTRSGNEPLRLKPRRR
jgi:predicted aspartyl protease